MADNILKNEFMWEKKQEKKKLYKNWKLYASALGITVIGAGTGLGVYYGVFANHSDVVKIDLSTLEFETTISGTENMKAEDAFNEFISNNSTITDLETNVEAGTFTAPTYTTSGSLVINATATGKYTGTITVTINAIGQTDLSTLELNKTISGTENITKEDALNVFLENNNTITDLKDNVEAGTFTKPSYTSTGKLDINTKENSKYTGTITVTINAIGQTNLTDLNLNTSAITGIENMTKEDTLNTFLENNSTITDLETNVEAGTFTQPTYTTSGSLVINATTTGKYTGTITVTINAIGQTDLSTLNQNVIDATSSNMSKEEAFNAFKENNKDKDLDFNKFDVTITKQPGYGTDNGSFTITAKTNTKYNGTITISIKANKQEQLSSVLSVKEIEEIESIDEAVSAVLLANDNPTGLPASDLKAKDFKTPNYKQSGSVTITVTNENSKYIGSVNIIIKLNSSDIRIANSAERVRQNPSIKQAWDDFYWEVMDRFIKTQVFIMTKEEEQNILVKPSGGFNNKYAKDVTDRLFENTQSFAKKYEKKYGLEELVEQYFSKIEISYGTDNLINIDQKEKKFIATSRIYIWLVGSSSTIPDISISSSNKWINYIIKD